MCGTTILWCSATKVTQCQPIVSARCLNNNNVTRRAGLFLDPASRFFFLAVVHPGTDAPMPAFLFLATLVLMLEMAVYGKWLFVQTRSLRRANPSYQLAVIGNFLVATLGTRVCVLGSLLVRLVYYGMIKGSHSYARKAQVL